MSCRFYVSGTGVFHAMGVHFAVHYGAICSCADFVAGLHDGAVVGAMYSKAAEATCFVFFAAPAAAAIAHRNISPALPAVVVAGHFVRSR